MSWFLVVLLTSGVGDLYDGFLWYDPIFESKEECIDWANSNPDRIIQSLNYEFDNWEVQNILCIREDRLDDINMQPYVPMTEVSM